MRELVQNAFDARDVGGHELELNYDAGAKTLTLANAGASLQRSDLVLGCTKKREQSEARGKFGEGMKLAWSSLCRMGCTVEIRCNEERWTPRLGHSETFCTEILMVDIDACEPENGVRVVVTGVSVEDWSLVQTRILELSTDEVDASSDHGDRVLISQMHRGKLYARGIYVCELEGARYGYDLPGVSLDRDRCVPYDWSLRVEMQVALSSAALLNERLCPELADALLDAKSMESRAFCSLGAYVNPDLLRKIADEIKTKHGDDIVMVVDDEEQQLAQREGRKCLRVDADVCKLLAANLPTIRELEVEISERAIEIVADADLDGFMLRELRWLRDVLALGSTWTLRVVRFPDDSTRVWVRDCDVRISSELMSIGGGALLVAVSRSIGRAGVSLDSDAGLADVFDRVRRSPAPVVQIAEQVG
jgi:hypothetical protein